MHDKQIGHDGKATLTGEQRDSRENKFREIERDKQPGKSRGDQLEAEKKPASEKGDPKEVLVIPMMRRGEGADPPSPRREPVREEEAPSSERSSQMRVGSEINPEQRLSAAEKIKNLFKELVDAGRKKQQSLDRPKTIIVLGETQDKPTAISMKKVFGDRKPTPISEGQPQEQRPISDAGDGRVKEEEPADAHRPAVLQSEQQSGQGGHEVQRPFQIRFIKEKVDPAAGAQVTEKLSLADSLSRIPRGEMQAPGESAGQRQPSAEQRHQVINLEELPPKQRSTRVSRQIVEERFRYMYHSQLSAPEEERGPRDR